MRFTRSPFLAILGLAATGCGGTSNVSFPRENPSPMGPAGPQTLEDASIPNDDAATPTSANGPSDAASVDAGAPSAVDAATDPIDAAAPEPIDAAPVAMLPPADAGDLFGALKALTANCTVASNGTYATDRSATAAI